MVPSLLTVQVAIDEHHACLVDVTAPPRSEKSFAFDVAASKLCDTGLPDYGQELFHCFAARRSSLLAGLSGQQPGVLLAQL